MMDVNAKQSTSKQIFTFTASSSSKSPSKQTTFTFTASRSPSSKYRLWNQQSNVNQNKKPFVSAVKQTVIPPADAEEDCLDDTSFFRYLNLAVKKQIANKPYEDLLVNWPLRNISKNIKCKRNKKGKITIPQFKVFNQNFYFIHNILMLIS